jgi:hypothetical protein
MTYSRPGMTQLQAEVTRVGKATAVITGQTIKSALPSEGLPDQPFTVVTAYEADE